MLVKYINKTCSNQRNDPLPIAACTVLGRFLLKYTDLSKTMVYILSSYYGPVQISKASNYQVTPCRALSLQYGLIELAEKYKRK